MDGTLFTADWVLPVTSAPIRNGALLVREGRIAAVGTATAILAASSPTERLDLGRCALLPGFVNAHTHLELAVLRGFCEDRDFFAWIRRLTTTKYTHLTVDDLVNSARWAVAEATAAGVTTVGDIADVGGAWPALREGGLRAVAFQEVFAPEPELAESAAKRLEARLDALASLRGERMQLGVSPHAPYTVSPDLFQRVHRIAVERDLPVSIHIAESRAESLFVKNGTGPFGDFLAERGLDWVAPGCSPVEYLDRLGVLSDRVLLAHCVHCDAVDVKRISGAGAAIAHCPKANAKLGHGVAPLAEFLGRKVRVGMGTDSVLSNNVCDVLDDLRHAVLAARLVESGGGKAAPSATEALRIATLGGAEALGLADRIGSLEEGKAADFVAIDLSGVHVGPLHDVEAALLWSASAADVVLTAVEGEILYREGEWTRCSLDELRDRVQEIADRLRPRHPDR